MSRLLPRALVCALMLTLALAAARTDAATTAAKPAATSTARKAPAKTPATAAKPAAKPATPAPALSGSGDGGEMGAGEIMEIAKLVQDSTQAGEAVKRLRKFLANDPKPMFRSWGNNALLMALINSKAPVAEILVAADTAEAGLPQDYTRRSAFYAGMAEVLAEREGGVEPGMRFARKAMDVLPPTPDAVPMIASARGVLGALQLKNGETLAAIGSLSQAVAETPDSQTVLRHLGEAYAKAGRSDEALNAYLRSVGVFAGADTAGAAPLRALWATKHGSLAGLDAALAPVRKASTQRIALEPRKDERPAPDFTLTKLVDSTSTVSLASLKGKVAVIDFWGSWCGPCRAELPLFQKLHDKYKDDARVAFLGINWERPNGTPNERRQRAWDYMIQNKLTFPTVTDLEGKTPTAFAVEGFPTVYVIDPTGRIRYSNRGVVPDVDAIIEAQVRSLLD